LQLKDNAKDQQGMTPLVLRDRTLDVRRSQKSAGARSARTTNPNAQSHGQFRV